MPSPADPNAPFWLRTPLHALNTEQWEALCDGCGRCCLHKLEDEESGEVFYTQVACRLLDLERGRCRDYPNRSRLQPECVRVDPALAQLEWLPPTCAYRLLAAGRPLPAWHPLVSGSFETVHEAGISVHGWAVPEDQIASADEMQDFLIEFADEDS